MPDHDLLRPCERCGNTFDSYDSHVEISQTNNPGDHLPEAETFEYYLCSVCTGDYREWLDRGNTRLVDST